jgi:hypothetical protein
MSWTKRSVCSLRPEGVPLSRAPASALPAAKPTPPDFPQGIQARGRAHMSTDRGPPARQISPLVIQLSAPAASSVRCDSRRAGAGHFSGACLAESTLTERRRVSDYLPLSLSPFIPISAPHCLLRDEARERLAEKGILSTLGAPNLRPRTRGFVTDRLEKGLVIRTAAAPRASQPLASRAPFPDRRSSKTLIAR